MEEKNMLDDIQRELFTKEELAAIVSRMGREISWDYKGKNLLMVSVLKGSVVFMADLMRAVTEPLSIDFMVDLNIPLEEYHLLIVEDILDSGKTLSYLREVLEARNPRSIKICTLFDKPERREADVTPDYVGARIPDAFIVGYGLDYAGKYRNLPFVGVLKPEIYTS